MIDVLNLTNNSRVKNGIPKVLKGKVSGKLEQIKDPNIAMGIINEIQDEAFDLVIANDKTCREEKGYYEMRYLHNIPLKKYLGGVSVLKVLLAGYCTISDTIRSIQLRCFDP